MLEGEKDNIVETSLALRNSANGLILYAKPELIDASRSIIEISEKLRKERYYQKIDPAKSDEEVSKELEARLHDMIDVAMTFARQDLIGGSLSGAATAVEAFSPKSREL